MVKLEILVGHVVMFTVLCSNNFNHTEADRAKFHNISIVHLNMFHDKKKKKKDALFFVDDISGESGWVCRAGEWSALGDGQTASAWLAQDRLHHLWQSQLLLQRQWASGPKEPDCCLHAQRKGSCLNSHLCMLTGVHSPWLRLICSLRRRCVVILFLCGIIFKSIIKGTPHCAAESSGLYHLWFMEYISCN